MASLAKLPKKVGGSSGPKAKGIRRPNPVRQIMVREERVRENSVSAPRAPSISAASGPALIASGSGIQCPNKACPSPNVVDGTCRTCGRVADDSNIVSEVQFGETSSGAAVVQGSFLGADQGGVRTISGPAFRRVAGSGAGEARERSLKEAKAIMQQYVHRLNLSPALCESGFRLYRMAAMNNFTQGRKGPVVIAMCLYAACRKEQNCKIMMIDLADICKENVFKLGRIYKCFLAKFPEAKEGPNPIILEDLIWRFASKLEFFGETNKVALSAVRIAQRMQKDHMTHGRRPAGICGAAIIMAARAHSFRRTVREVVYIAKVTTHTLQIRMEEFANVPSAQMTIDEFHTNDFLDEQHDPPYWYKQSPAWKEAHRRSRKRKAQDVDGDHDPEREATATPNPEKRQKQSSSELGSPLKTSVSPAMNPEAVALSPSATPSPTPTHQPEGTVGATDADGFAIPALPVKAAGRDSTHVDRMAIAAARGGDGQLKILAEEFGDADAVPDRSTEAAMAAAMGIDIPASDKNHGRGTGKGKAKGRTKSGASSEKKIAYDEQWQADEDALEEEMEVHLSNPRVILAARDASQKEGDLGAVQRLQDFAHERCQDEAIDMAILETRVAHTPSITAPKGLVDESWEDPSVTPRSKVSSDPIVSAAEFADDPEVMCCELGAKEIKIKEQLWTNENRDWMSAIQQKIFKKKMEARGPPKKTRKRTKVARIGEGQSSPASSAGEAAVQALSNRAVSKKFNYAVYTDIFTSDYHRPGSEYGDTDSNVGEDGADASRAASTAGDDNRARIGRSAVEAGADNEEADTGSDEGDKEDDQGGYNDQSDSEDEEIDPFANNEDNYDDEDEWQ